MRFSRHNVVEGNDPDRKVLDREVQWAFVRQVTMLRKCAPVVEHDGLQSGTGVWNVNGVALPGGGGIPRTLIVTEGFGRIPLAERIAALAGELAGAGASLNGATQVRAGAMRPEIIIPRKVEMHAAQAAGEPAAEGLKVGARVRIIRVPHFGRLATICELPAAAERIETGAVARVLRAKLDDGAVVTIPRANVELL